MSKVSHKEDPWLQAKDFGIDTTLLLDNLKLSYEERALKHQQALDALWALIEAKESHEKSQQSHTNSPKVAN